MTTSILAGKLFDPLLLRLVPNQLIAVNTKTGLIVDVSTFDPDAVDGDDPDTIDLRHLTVVPGFVDVHVHFFLHSYDETSWQDQLTTEPLGERVVRATVHARRTLQAGFTTVRDLGTEGAGDADVALRKCLSGTDPLIPGPRYFTANRAVVCTGSYGPKSSIRVDAEGVEGITGAEVADGETECVRAVRRQVGAGADWIKIYADYPARSRTKDVSPRLASQALPTFSRTELTALITTSHSLGVKIAAHAKTASAIRAVVDLGIDSLEHGNELHKCPEALARLAQPDCRTTYVPTLAAYHTIFTRTGDAHASGWAAAQRSFLAALFLSGRNGIQIACGGDTGVFPHGANALEMELMHRLGMPWQWVLRWATWGGWRCISGAPDPEEDQDQGGEDAGGRPADNDVPFGVLRPRFAADIVGLAGTVDTDDTELFAQTIKTVEFVMKAGRVYKRDGQEVVY